MQGRIIAIAEGRQQEELAALLEKESAIVLRCPMLSILDHPDQKPIVEWLRHLVAGRFSHLILLTGEGLRRLMAAAEREGMHEAVIAALAKIRIITRGPKPVRALKEIGLSPTKVAVAPTTEGVIATLKDETLAGALVGVQLYSESNAPLTDFLKNAGATPFAVLPYIYAPAADSESVSQLIEKIATGKVDVLVFTSSPQIDRLFEVAAETKQEEKLVGGLQRLKVAAVGPIVKEKLLEKNIQVNIMPEQGFVMKNLVQHIKRALSD